MGEVNERSERIRLAAPRNAEVTVSPSYVPGAWDAIALPADQFFSNQNLRRSLAVLVYGPMHLFRAAWLAGAVDYLKEPWEPEELFLRLEGSRPAVLEWSWAGHRFRLEDKTLGVETGRLMHLPTTEADLLKILAQRRGLVVSREVLAWAANCSPGRVVDTLMARLRGRILSLSGAEGNPIPSVRGLGYRIP